MIMNAQDEVIREMCRLLVVKPKHLLAQGIAMNDYEGLERFFKCPGWFTDPNRLAEARLAVANHKAFLREAGIQMAKRFSGGQT